MNDAVRQGVRRRTGESSGDVEPARSAIRSPGAGRRCRRPVDRFDDAAGAEASEVTAHGRRPGRGADPGHRGGQPVAVLLGQHRGDVVDVGAVAARGRPPAATLRKPWCSKPVTGSRWRTGVVQPGGQLERRAGARTATAARRPAPPRRGRRRASTPPVRILTRGARRRRARPTAARRRPRSASRRTPARPAARPAARRPRAQSGGAAPRATRRTRSSAPARRSRRRPVSAAAAGDQRDRQRGVAGQLRDQLRPARPAEQMNGPSSSACGDPPVLAVPAHGVGHRRVAGREDGGVVEQAREQARAAPAGGHGRPRPAQVQAYLPSSHARPPSPSSERPEGVDHDGELVEPLRAEAALDRARLRAVRVPARVQRDRAAADARALAGLVVAADVEHDLVAVDVGVVVRHRHGQRVVVDLARHEVADDEVVALEDLVHRRRLVHAAGDRLEVGDVEGVRVEAAVPADHVERVLRHDVHGAGEPAGPTPRCLT